jgi:hypothetical protein
MNNMAQLNQDFVISANNSLQLRFEGIYNENTNALLSVADIEGASWACTPLEEETTALISKDLISGGLTVPEDGTVIVQLLTTDTVGLSGEFSHELRLKHAGGIQTAARGRMTIKYQIANNPL